MTRADIEAVLAACGCVNPRDEADMLLEAAAGDDAALASFLERRSTGEPVEWIVGWAPFLGLRLVIGPGVYVPRVQTEVVARRAAHRLPAGGLAIDLATGCGTIAAYLASTVPTATVLATEADPTAAGWARANQVMVFEGDLDEPLPPDLLCSADMLVANAPYVPTPALATLPRDVRAFEPRHALDGGPDGLDLIRRVSACAPRWLKPGGYLIVEVGAGQEDAFPGTPLFDDDGDLRGLEARF